MENMFCLSEHNTSEIQSDEFLETSIFKCDHCPFISLTNLDKQDHLARVHAASINNNNEQHNGFSTQQNQQLHHQRVDCPGCSNVFYTHKTLEAHLKFDHLMKDDHLTKIMDAFYIKSNQCLEKSMEKQNSICNDVIKLLSNDTIQNRNRIYLKNFECLKEPQKTVDNCDDKCNKNEITDKNYADQDVLVGTLQKPPYTTVSDYPSKQKILIKSVNALREPTLLQQSNEIHPNIYNSDSNQYSLQNKADLYVGNKLSNFIDSDGVKGSFEYNHLSSIIQSSSSFSKQITHNSINTYPTTFLSKELNSIKRLEDLKSVENFTLTPISTFTVPRLENNTHNNIKLLPSKKNDFINIADATLGYSSYLLDSNVNKNNVNGTTMNNLLLTNNYSNSFENGDINVYFNSYHNDVDDTNTNYLWDTTADNSKSDSYCTTTTITTTDIDCLQGNKACNINEQILKPCSPTPPALNTTQSLPLNNTSNVKCMILPLTDDSKSLTFQRPSQEPKRTLHLRTVDELNLMNKKEVQNLITPNLESNNGVLPFHSSVESSEFDVDKFHILSDNSFNCDENFKLQDLDTQMITEWTDVLANDIDCIIAECENLRPDNLSQSIENTSMPSFINTKNILTSINDACSELPIINYEEQLSTPEQGKYRKNVISSSEYLRQDHLSTINKENDTIIAYSNKEEQIMTNSDQNMSNDEARENTDILNENNIPSQSIALNHFNLSDSHINSLDNLNLIQTMDILHPTEVQPFANSAFSNVSYDELPKRKIYDINASTKKINTSVISPIKTNLHNVEPLSEKFAELSTQNNKNRIYIANNLMCEKQNALKIGLSQPSGISVRGRPFGSNRTTVKATRGNSTDSVIIKNKNTVVSNSNNCAEFKCSIKNCTFRFKSDETLNYHMKCHESHNNCRLIICPECKSKEFRNWNTLHTHLWRVHSVDMELYSCKLCSFKTPVYSRLINTHEKIHYDERNFKCHQCDKAFKNSKQLKNHRRWHRIHSQILQEKNVKEPKTPVVEDKDHTKETFSHRCLHCGTVFTHLKSLRAHCCLRDSNTTLKCKICQKNLSSKSSLTLHMNNKHNESSRKRFICSSCDYSTNDHNAFRRHRMTHTNNKMYNCSYCGYKCIQSLVYQKHVRVKHPEHLDSLIYKCIQCTFFTVNKVLWLRHLDKHAENSACH